MKINTILLSYSNRFEKTDNKISLEIHSRLKNTFLNWIDSLSVMKVQKGISRNMVLVDNYLFIKINEDIKDIYTLKKDNSFLVFFEANNAQVAFEKENIIDFFKKQVKKLIGMDVINYFITLSL